MRIVEIGLAIVLAILLARIAIVTFAPVEIPDTEITQAPISAPATTVRSPFPTADVAAPAVAVTAAPDDVADTSLNLMLTGVWPDEDGGGSATIKKPDNQQGRFAVGDEIVNGVTLDAVYFDRVILLRNGLQEALRFENMPERRGAAPGTVPTRAASIDNARPAIRDAVVASGVSDIFRITPRPGAGGKILFQLTSGPNRVAFTRLGLKNGDELVSINGVSPPSSPPEITNFVRSIQSQQQVTVIVKRGDENVTIPVSLAQFRNQ